MDTGAGWGRGGLSVPAALRSVIPSNAFEVSINRGSFGDQRLGVFDRQLRRWDGGRFVPFDYQSDLISGLQSLMLSGIATGLVVLPTGAGKTSVGVAAILGDLEASGAGLVIWIAPQKELLQQAVAAWERVWWTGVGPHSLDLKVLRSRNEAVALGRSTVVFGTPMTMSAWLEDSGARSRVTHLVFDEAHHLGAPGFSSVWQGLRSEAKGLRAAIGLSATPSRGEMAAFGMMSDAFDGTLFYPSRLLPDPVRVLRERGILASIEVRRIEGVPHYIKTVRDAGYGKLGVELLGSDQDYWMACVSAAQMCSGRVIVYCPNRQLGELFARHLVASGQSAEYLDGDDSFDVRVAVLERFRDGSTRILVNVGLLLEGVDCPTADTALITQAIGSQTKLLQIAGRVMRGPAVGGKASAEILCADAAVARFYEEMIGSPDYASLWRRGVSL
jgi:superfamily II DNA or RNA helicase